MEAKDLRIGNWVLENGSYRQIEADDFYNPQLLNPIPLKDVIKSNVKLTRDYRGYWVDCVCGIEETFNNKFWFFFGFENIEEKICIGEPIEFLHELQNIVYWLKKVELEINL